VDGTLIDAWASMKSFRRQDGQDGSPSGAGRNAERDFRGETRSNETHAPSTDPHGYIARQSASPRGFASWGLLIENRHGPIIDVRTTHATGRPEREAAEAMIQAAARGRRATPGADKAYDAAVHIAPLRTIGVTPLMAQNTFGRPSAIDGWTTRHAGYAISQRRRKLTEEPFGWIKSAAGLRETRHRGLPRGSPGRHADRSGLQSGSSAQASGKGGTTTSDPSKVLDRWRIIEIEG
jgi:hypothetical protein